METSLPGTPPPLIPRRYRLILSAILLATALAWALSAVASLYGFLGMPEKGGKPGIIKALSLYANPHYPDHFPWVEYSATWPDYKHLLAACGLFALGLLIAPDLPSKKKAGLPIQAELVLLGLVCLFGVFMRFHEGDKFPYGLHYDESTNAMIGREFIEEWKPENQAKIADLKGQVRGKEDQIRASEKELRGQENEADKKRLEAGIKQTGVERDGLRRQIESLEVPVFTTEGFGKATAHMYQIGWAMKLFGTSVFTIRLPTMIAGSLGVLALFLLLRLLTDAPTALLGAAFLAALRWHVNFSRVAYDAIEAPLIITATAFFFFLAFKHRDEIFLSKDPGNEDINDEEEEEEESRGGGWSSWLWHLFKTSPIWLVAGYCFGLAIYSYKPLYLFPGIIGGFLAIRFLMQRQMLRWNAIGLLLFALAAWFCAKEMLDYRKAHPEAFSQRLNMVSVVHFNEPFSANWNRIRENLAVSLRMFHIRGDSNPRHNHAYAPMVHPLLGALFPLGMAWALVRWRSRLGLFSLGWFVAMFLPMVLSIEAPNTLRAICTIPVIAIWSAVALRQIGVAFLCLAEDWLPGRRWLSEPLRWTGWVVTALVAVSFWWGEYHLYFRDQAPKNDPYIHFDAKFVDMAHYVNEQKGKFYCVGDANGHNALKLLNKSGIWRNHLFVQQELPARGAPDEDALFIVMEPWNRPDESRWIEWLYGPDVTAEEPKDPFGNKIFAAYRVPAEIKNKHRGFSVELETTASGKPETARFTHPSLTFAPGDETLPAPFTAKGKAMWVIPEGRGGVHKFKVETQDRFKLSIDKEVILDATPGTAPSEVQKDLPAGGHQVEFLFDSKQFKDLTKAAYQVPGDPNWKEFSGEMFHDRGMIGGGLRFKFWHGSRKWDGPPKYTWADPFINMRWNGPYMFPLSMEWDGFVDCPVDGNYSFGTEGWDYSLLEIDGKKLVETPGGKEQRNRYIQGPVQLTAGKHPIHVRYSDNIGGGEALKLYWQVPGKGREIIPTAALSY